MNKLVTINLLIDYGVICIPLCYNFHIVTVRFNTTIVRDDESAGSLTFILVTNRPADELFAVQVCTEDIDPGAFGLATGNNRL